jgi:hypothetical protein
MSRRQPRFPFFALCLGALLAFPAAAQDEDQQPAESSEAEEPPREEIIVVAPRPGSRREVDRVYEDPVRARVLKDLYEMREDEAEVAILDAAASRDTDRVRFGYDPTEDYLRRKEIDLETPQRDTVRPATIFRISF